MPKMTTSEEVAFLANAAAALAAISRGSRQPAMDLALDLSSLAYSDADAFDRVYSYLSTMADQAAVEAEADRKARTKNTEPEPGPEPELEPEPQPE